MIINKKEEKRESKPKKKKVELTAWRDLVAKQISEKVTELNKDNRYVFRVTPNTNKIMVKRAIKELYGLDVISVNIINVPRKKKRLGKQIGWRSSFKKAIIQIKEGQKIN